MSICTVKALICFGKKVGTLALQDLNSKIGFKLS
jgi:hypothetical protein